MYADIVIDISHESLDRPFQYRIPESLVGQVQPGMWVLVPFGRRNTQKKGFVLKLGTKANIDPDRIKELTEIISDDNSSDKTRIALAVWMYREYGGNLIQSLRVVMPARKNVRLKQVSFLVRTSDEKRFLDYLDLARKKNWKGRVRLMEALLCRDYISSAFARQQLKIASDAIKALEEEKLIQIETKRFYRSVLPKESASLEKKQLNEEQQAIVDKLISSYQAGVRTPALLYGITGSGKTEVYMHLIEWMIRQNKQVIVLIPEISLTYQVILNFYSRFGEQVSMINSRLSDGERSDQLERARNGEISIMVGPRSALFTPFSNLGLIIVDEEQEGAYNSEQIPRYHTRETADKLAQLTNSLLLLGSATPSIESFSRAESGEYRKFCLTKRAVLGSCLPSVQVVDMRKELESGNRSVFSRELREKMEECLAKKQQMMLFINRRGFSRVVSCRSCGKPIECPHCDVALTEHLGDKLVCHYCGYTKAMPHSCPLCGSPYLAGFGLGTQKAEMMIKAQFPSARVLRMDMDTTSKKDGHEQILDSFRRREADILVGTQMIVKGHDFPGVTLVGILAADMSLYNCDFRSSERTFQLLTQAAGRAGRGMEPGNVIIQTYDPENYSIQTAANQDYESFYHQEIRFRRRMQYPPIGWMCEVMAVSAEEKLANQWIWQVQLLINKRFCDIIKIIGPSDAPIARLKDMWRKHLYIRSSDHKAYLEAMELIQEITEQAAVQKVSIFVTVC